MEVNLDQMLEFCAYYQLNKHVAQLTIQTQPIIKPSSPINTNNKPKNARKKVELVEPKKVDKAQKLEKAYKAGKVQKVERPVRQKVQVVTKKDNIGHDRQKAQEQPQDINYFITHITSQNAQHSNQKGYQDRTYREIGYKNYETFGRQKEMFQFDTFESKMQKQSQTYSKVPAVDRPYEFKSYLSKSNFQTPQRINADPFPSSTKQFWENPVYETRRNDRNDFGNLIYSPVRRENLSPSQSSIMAQIRSDLSKSKSKSKLKKKNTQRPLYDPSKLSSKERQSEMRAKRNMFEQSILSNSFIITNQQLRVSNNAKKNNDEQAKRETSTTNVRKNNRREDQYQLDDGMEQIISQLASEQRNAPIAISLLSKNAKT